MTLAVVRLLFEWHFLHAAQGLRATAQLHLQAVGRIQHGQPFRFQLAESMLAGVSQLVNPYFMMHLWDIIVFTV